MLILLKNKNNLKIFKESSIKVKLKEYLLIKKKITNDIQFILFIINLLYLNKLNRKYL